MKDLKVVENGGEFFVGGWFEPGERLDTTNQARNLFAGPLSSTRFAGTPSPGDTGTYLGPAAVSEAALRQALKAIEDYKAKSPLAGSMWEGDKGDVALVLEDGRLRYLDGRGESVVRFRDPVKLRANGWTRIYDPGVTEDQTPIGRCWRAKNQEDWTTVDRLFWNGSVLLAYQLDGRIVASRHTLRDAIESEARGFWVRCPNTSRVPPVPPPPFKVGDTVLVSFRGKPYIVITVQALDGGLGVSGSYLWVDDFMAATGNYARPNMNVAKAFTATDAYTYKVLSSDPLAGLRESDRATKGSDGVYRLDRLDPEPFKDGLYVLVTAFGRYTYRLLDSKWSYWSPSMNSWVPSRGTTLSFAADRRAGRLTATTEDPSVPVPAPAPAAAATRGPIYAFGERVVITWGILRYVGQLQYPDEPGAVYLRNFRELSTPGGTACGNTQGPARFPGATILGTAASFGL